MRGIILKEGRRTQGDDGRGRRVGEGGKGWGRERRERKGRREIITNLPNQKGAPLKKLAFVSSVFWHW